METDTEKAIADLDVSDSEELKISISHLSGEKVQDLCKALRATNRTIVSFKLSLGGLSGESIREVLDALSDNCDHCCEDLEILQIHGHRLEGSALDALRRCLPRMQQLN